MREPFVVPTRRVGKTAAVMAENIALRAQRDSLLAALISVTDYAGRQICEHEDTHRAGFIWEICDQCGMKWADDEGGRPDFKMPKPIVDALDAIAAAKAQE